VFTIDQSLFDEHVIMLPKYDPFSVAARRVQRTTVRSVTYDHGYHYITRTKLIRS
jgi:hypothetical protein